MEFQPTNYFVVPARFGSVRLRGKNFLKLGGIPLFMWSVLFSLRHAKPEQVFVSTDNQELLGIADAIHDFRVVERSEGVSGSEATTEDWLSEFLEQNSLFGKRIIVLQPTSPFRSDQSFLRLNEAFHADVARGAFTCEDSGLKPNGSMYALSTTATLEPGFLSAPERLAVPSAHWWENIDIDFPSQFDNASALLTELSTASYKGSIIDSIRANEAARRFFRVARNTSLGMGKL